MRFLFPAVVATAILSLPDDATAWGRTGHQVVCEIAYQELTSTARSEVNRLIGQDSDYRYFYDSCNWADVGRKRRDEHYVNLDRSALEITALDLCPLARNCVLTAILGEIRDLSLSTDDFVKLDSLKYLGHWMGDLHQPLHVSFADDRGGNSIRENGPCQKALHAVWDTCILERTLGEDALEVAESLHGSITAAQRAAWTEGAIGTGLVIDWANESFAKAIEPDVEYCVRRDGGCWYSGSIDTLGSDDDERSVRVDMDYLDRHRDTVAELLSKAGVRLGWMLNEILDN